MAEIGRNLIVDFGPLDAAALPPSGEALVDPAGKAASAAADDCRQCLHLPVVGMIINIEAGDPRRVSRPEVALPAADPHKAEIVEFDVAIMALADAPEQHRFTKPVSGAWAKVHGQGTAQLQLSNRSPTICQLGMSLIRALRSDAMARS